MWRLAVACLLASALPAVSAEYMEKTPFQMSRAFSPGVITDGGKRYGDRFVEMRKEYFKDGNYPGSALITVSNFARPGIEIEIQAVGVIGDHCSNENPCSAEAIAKKK